MVLGVPIGSPFVMLFKKVKLFDIKYNQILNYCNLYEFNKY